MSGADTYKRQLWYLCHSSPCRPLVLVTNLCPDCDVKACQWAGAIVIFVLEFVILDVDVNMLGLVGQRYLWHTAGYSRHFTVITVILRL